MLEIPEVATLAAQSRRELTGKRIQRVTLNASPHKFAWFFGEPDAYHELLHGAVIDGAVPYAGRLEMTAGDIRLTFMDGVNLRLIAPGDKTPPKHQMLLQFEDDSALCCSVQMYGGLECFREGENTNSYYLVAKSSPSPLTDAFTFEHFMGIVNAAKPTLSAKALLATEQRIPGLGNGVLQDILFNARVHPKRKVAAMDDGVFEKLFRSIKDTLSLMTAQGGRDTERDLFGINGGYKTLLSKLTLDKPCPVCGGVITKEAYMGGAVYYCATCQPL